MIHNFLVVAAALAWLLVAIGLIACAALVVGRVVERRASAHVDRMVRDWEAAEAWDSRARWAAAAEIEWQQTDLSPYLFDAAEFVDHVQTVRQLLDRHEFEMSVLADIEHLTRESA